MPVRVMVDLNVRVRGGQTFVGLEAIGDAQFGDRVEVFEVESQLVGVGQITDIDHERNVAYIAVNWSSLEAT